MGSYCLLYVFNLPRLILKASSSLEGPPGETSQDHVQTAKMSKEGESPNSTASLSNLL